MAEKMQTGLRRMGTERWKYLDMANISFAGGDYISCKGYINAFLETIEDGRPEAKEIRENLDSIEDKRRKLIQDLIKETEDIGYLEQSDIRHNARERIEIDAINDMKATCWIMALKYGLFGA